MSPVGLRVRELREGRGWTQAELARRAGIRRATVNRIENSRIKSIDLEVLEKLATALEVHPAALIERTEKERRRNMPDPYQLRISKAEEAKFEIGETQTAMAGGAPDPGRPCLWVSVTRNGEEFWPRPRNLVMDVDPIKPVNEQFTDACLRKIVEDELSRE
jgi:transcriptional regulator with XRE-family HTH domain